MTKKIESLSEKFNRLYVEWDKESCFMSSITDMINLPSYQEIINMGYPVVPLILNKLKEDPDHLFWALCVITQENPVPYEHQGKIALMAQDWIEWGRKNGIIK
jgi:hypothetical protein